MPDIKWECLTFQELGVDGLYAILKARGEVFAVEQNCVYLDMDGLDQKSHHFVGWAKPSDVAAYLRIIPPGMKFNEVAIGRVITTKPYRQMGFGKILMQNALQQIGKLYPDQSIRLSAQQYLEKFYRDFGFMTVSKPYDEDGTPHIEMLLSKNGKI
jgi:ElaA protein